MNKRISTLFTASLLFSSVFGSNVFAENLADVVGNGKYYKIMRSAQYNPNVNSGSWYAMQKSDKDMFLSLDKDGNLTISTKITDLNDATWTVKEGSVEGTYMLTTASGHVLTYNANTVAPQTSFYTEEYKNNTTVFPTEPEDNAFTIALTSSLGNMHMGYTADKDANPVGWSTPVSGQDYQLLFNLVDITENVEAGDLNGFFNSKGFNLAVNYDPEKVTLDENIFGGDSRIWAFEVNSKTCKKENWDSKKGYKVSQKGANGEDLYIPEGMYFFEERILKSGVDATQGLQAEDIDWLASTLIMVSPTETVETTVEDRDEGQGFKLVAVKGSEFIFEENVSDYKVGDLPIANACFDVKDNQVGAYPFAISLPNFYYQADDDDEATEKLTPKTDMALGLIEFTTDNVLYLTTVKGSAENIFKFSDSALKDGKELLKTTKEAAVYTIKIVAGNSEDAKLINKYLTVATDGSDFEWVAKGSAIANTAYPSFQYTITNVEDEDLTDDVEKYTAITFTNRETNESFTANLFPEPSYGENCYSVALIAVNGKEKDPEMSIQPLKVVSNTYKVETDGDAQVLDENVIIKLEPVSVDEYAGFYNVDNESIRMIRFARDKFDTSNCWYAGAASDANKVYSLRTGAEDGLFVEDIYAAAQFQLVKAPEATTIERTFVYNNTTTEDVDNVPNADKVSAYKYALRYVNDGSVTDYYLTRGQSPSYELDLTKPASADDIEYFYIKENADGSVSLFVTEGTFKETTSGVYVAKHDQKSVIATEINSSNTGIKYLNTATNNIYAATSAANSLKTYLDAEAPSLSWEGEGHVTLQNATGMAGDYITVNDDNEGILVNDAAETFYLHETDKNAIVPSFYISLGKGEGSNALSERNFLFNPVDSVSYPVNMTYDPDYQLSKSDTKAIFKAGTLDASRDTMTVEGLKGEKKVIASEADNESVWGGLDRFKFQIIENAELEGLYNIRQVKGSINEDAVGDPVPGTETVYLASSGQKLYFTTEKAYALDLAIKGVEAPTANESVSATEVKVVAYDGSINIKNAAGKNVVISTILGQIVANEVLTSDNATIAVPAGIAIVSVDGEEAVKVSVR